MEMEPLQQSSLIPQQNITVESLLHCIFYVNKRHREKSINQYDCLLSFGVCNHSLVAFGHFVWIFEDCGRA